MSPGKRVVGVFFISMQLIARACCSDS